MKKEFTQWNTASESLSENIICALECINKYNYQVIIKHLPNEEHELPVKVVAHDLNDPFGWKCVSQFHRSEEELKDALKRAKNDTERDLIQNWVWIFGEPEAIQLYKEKRLCTAGLFKGMGTCSQVRITDMVKYFRDNGENERADLWEKPDQFFNSGLWTPINNHYWDNAEGMSYAVYFNNNKENLPLSAINEILDNSVKEIALNSLQPA